jgi:hypothetical protein
MKMKMKILEIISTLRESEKEEENHEIGTQMRAIFFQKKLLQKMEILIRVDLENKVEEMEEVEWWMELELKTHINKINVQTAPVLQEKSENFARSSGNSSLLFCYSHTQKNKNYFHAKF